jgi:hypothetical protein
MDDVAASEQEAGFSRGARYGTYVLLVFAFAAILGGTQAALFYGKFTPRLAQANTLLFDLVVEKAQENLYYGIEVQLESLQRSAAHGEGSENRLAMAWDDFDDHFASAPLEALQRLHTELPALGAGLRGAGDDIERLGQDLERLQEIYSDPYKQLLAELERPPLYLWPIAPALAAKSGYRHAATLNRALYLAQVGEIGTARVMLTGLHASTDDPAMLGLTNYTLGRLQFELFRSRPEAEFYTQSVMYLRESLQADPDAPLAKRFFDYLLSLSQTESVPRAGEGRPTTPSEGEGAAISADKRKF